MFNMYQNLIVYTKRIQKLCDMFVFFFSLYPKYAYVPMYTNKMGFSYMLTLEHHYEKMFQK